MRGGGRTSRHRDSGSFTGRRGWTRGGGEDGDGMGLGWGGFFWGGRTLAERLLYGLADRKSAAERGLVDGHRETRKESWRAERGVESRIGEEGREREREGASEMQSGGRAAQKGTRERPGRGDRQAVACGALTCAKPNNKPKAPPPAFLTTIAPPSSSSSPPSPPSSSSSPFPPPAPPPSPPSPRPTETHANAPSREGGGVFFISFPKVRMRVLVCSDVM